MKLTGIREWFRKCIDNYGFVPPIKYVTPEGYQYAKSFEKKQPPIEVTNTGFRKLKINELSKMIKVKKLTTKRRVDEG